MDIPAMGDRFDGDVLGADPKAAWAAASTQADAQTLLLASFGRRA